MEMFKELEMFKRDVEKEYSAKIAGYLLEGYSIVAAMLRFGTVYLANGSESEMIRVMLHYYVNADEDGYEIKEEKVTVSKTFTFGNIKCLHEIHYRAIRDENDKMQYFEKQVIC